MQELEEWRFSFDLTAMEPKRLISEEEASGLMDAVIEYAEARGLCVGGGMGPFDESSQ